VADDFFLSFGSNAARFAQELARELAPANALIEQLSKNLASLDKQTGDVSRRTQQRLGKVAETDARRNGGGGGGVDPELGVQAAALTRDLQQMGAELEGVLRRLDAASIALGRIPAETRRQQENFNRSISQQIADLKRTRNIETGRYGTGPGTVPGSQINRNAPIIGASLRDVTSSQISEASLTKITGAVETQGNRVVSALDRILASLNSGRVRVTGGGRGGGSGAAPAETALAQSEEKVERQAREATQSLDAFAVAMQAVERSLSATGVQLSDLPAAQRASLEQAVRTQIAAAIGGGRQEGETQTERQARNRAAASSARSDLPALNDAEYDRRVQAMQRLLRVGSSDFESTARSRGAAGIGKAELHAMAAEFTKQGYPTPANTKTTVDQLVERLQRSFAAFEAAGRTTSEDLRVGRRLTDLTTPAARDTLGTLPQTVRQLYDAVQSQREILRQNLSGGGLDTREGFAGQARVIRGLPGRGSAFGGIRDSLVGTAEDLTGSAAAQIREAASAHYFSRFQQPGFDPFHESVKTGGSAEEVKYQQISLRALRDATRLYDAQGREIIKLDEQIRKAEGALAAMTRAAEKAAAAGDQGALSDVQSRIPQVESRIEQLRGRLESTPGYQRFLSPEFAAGLAGRTESLGSEVEGTGFLGRRRRGLEAVGGQGEITAALEGLGQALGGLRTGIGTRDLIRSTPGLGYARGRGFVSSDDTKGPQEFAQITAAYKSYQNAIRSRGRIAAGDPETGDVDQSRLQRSVARTENKAEALLNEIQAVMGFAPSLTKLLGYVPQRFEGSEAARLANRDRILGPGQRPAEYAGLSIAQRGERQFQALSPAGQGNFLAGIQKKLAQAQAEEEAASKAAAEAQRQFARAEARAVKAANARGVSDDEVRAVQKQIIQRMRQQYTYPTGQGSGSPFFAHETGAQADPVAREQARLRALTGGVPGGNVGAVQLANTGLTDAQRRTKELAAMLERYQAIAGGAATETKRLGDAEQQVSRETRQVSDSLRITRGDLKALRQAAHQNPNDEGIQGALASAETLYAQQRSGRGGGGGGGRPGAPGAGGFDESGDRSVLGQILSVLRQIHGTLRGGVRISGTSGQSATGRTSTGARAAAVDARAFEGLANAIQDTHPELAALIRDERSVATVSRLVNEGVITQAQGLKLLRAEMGADSRAAKELNTELANARIIARGGAAAQRVVEAQRPTAAAFKENDKFDRRQQEQAERDAQASRTAARSQRELAAAQAAVSTATQLELQRLNQLHQAGASEVAVVEQQARAYRSLARDLHQLADAQTTRHAAQTLLSANGPKVSGGEVEEIARSARQINGFEAVDKGFANSVPQGGIMGEQSAFTKALFGDKGVWSRILASTGTFIVRNFTAGFVFGLTNELQKVVEQAIITESTFIRVSEALDATGKSVGNLRSDLQGISSDLGTSLNDVYTVAAGLVGLFDNTADLAGAVRVVAQLELISGGALNATEAMRVLSSVYGAFSDELEPGVEGLKHVADVFTVIQDNLSVNIEDTSEGVSRLAGLAQALKIPFEEIAVLVAQTAKLTGQSGSAAGEQLSRVLGALQTGSGRAAANQAFQGTAAPQYLAQGEYGKALLEMIKHWNDLSDAQQNSVATALGGQRQAATTAALFANGAKTLDVYTKAQYARGQADDRASKLVQTLNGQIRILSANFQNLANALVQTGILNALGGILLITNKVLSSVNFLLSKFNEFADSNPLTKFLKDTGFAVLGLVAGVALLGRVFRGLRATMSNLPIIGSRARAAASVEEEATGVAGGGRGVAATFSARTAAAATRFGTATLPGRPTALLGAGLDRGLAGPLASTGNALARFGTALQTSRDRILLETEARTGLTTSVRATALGTAGTFTRGVGVGLGTIGYGLSDIFRGRGDQFFSQVGDRFGARAQQYDFAAQQAGLGSSGSSARQQAAFRGLATAARGAEDASRGLSRGFARLSQSGIGAQLAVTGVLAVVGLFIAGMQEKAQDAKNAASALEASFGADRGKSPEQVAQEQFIGPNFQDAQEYASRFSKEANKGFFGGLSVGVNSIKAALSGDTPAERGGSINVDTQGIYDGFAGRIDAVKGSATQITEVANQVDQQITDMANAPALSVLSSEQQEAYRGQLELIRKTFAEHAEQVRLKALGLSEVDNFTSDQISKIGDIVSLFNSIGGDFSGFSGVSGGADFQSLFDQLGLSEGNSISPLLQKLTSAHGSGQTAIIARRINQTLLTSAQERLTTLIAGGGDPADIDTARQQVISLMQQVASSTDTIIQNFANDATTIATQATAQGRFGAGQAALQHALNRIQAQIPDATAASFSPGVEGFLATSGGGEPLPEHGGTNLNAFDPLTRAERAQREAAASQVAQALAQSQISQATQSYIRAKAGTRDPVADAQADLAIARITLAKLQQAFSREGVTGATLDQINQARQTYFDALAAEADAEHAVDTARLAAGAALLWNDVAKAQAASTSALADLTYAQRQYGTDSEQYFNALAAYRSAQQQVLQAQLAENAAARETAITRIAPGDAVAVAQARLQAAQAAQAEAARFGTSSTQYQEATQQVISAQRDVNSALNDVVNANTNLAIAIADAAGNTVRAAALQLKAAQQQLDQAIEASGGNTDTAAVKNAQAQVVQAQAALRDSKFQARVDTIDFRLEMERITADQAIAFLQNLLKTEDLTKAQRRELLLKIKGLRDDLRNTLTESGFNISDQVDLPSAYEVRRSLGLDPYQRNGRRLYGGTPERDAGAVGTGGGGGRNGDVVRALRDVQSAVVANGAQVIQKIDVTNQVARPEMVEEIARKVVRMIQRETRQGARANQSGRPKIVSGL
jgi:hypothetical protein